MIYRFIFEHRRTFPITVMCRVLEVSESGYAVWRSRGESRHRQEDQCLTETIKTIHVQSRGTYGTPRVQAELQAQDKRVSRARIRRLMKASGLKVRQKRKFRNTTQPKHRHPVAPHLLERKFTATRPNQKWTADITYLPTTEGWLYLAVVLDLFSRKVVGWAMQETLHTEVVLSALEMAQSRRRPRAGLLHHSDQRAGPMGCRLAQDKACNMPASSTGKPLSGWQRCKA